MRIGLTFVAEPMQTSVRWVGGLLMDTLAQDHELVRLPPEFAYRRDAERARLAEQFVSDCDLLVGQLHPEVLLARHRLSSSVPYVLHFLGALSRGAFNVPPALPLLNTNDVFIVNCAADRQLAAMLIENARIQTVPFAIDHETYYPLQSHERERARTALGLDQGDRVILYAGRITLEKNLHTVLRVFRALLDVVPRAHLVLAGGIQSVPFSEFGVVPVDFTRTIANTAIKLGLPRDRMRFCGHADPDQLRSLYAAADVAVNLTLHHDENFGIAQLEAMACGTPVIGTAWGGLKDTIIHGVTGFHIATTPTPHGVKVNWWEAVNRVAMLLRDEPLRQQFRSACIEHASISYSAASYRAAMEDVVDLAARGRARKASALHITAFAEEFWALCDPECGEQAPYRRGRRSRELYQALMGPYCGSSEDACSSPDDSPSGHLLCLASPLVPLSGQRYRIDDPVFPEQIVMPEELAAVTAQLIELLRETPVVRRSDLFSRCASYAPQHVDDALAWMIGSGLVLPSRQLDGWMPPSAVGCAAQTPLFTVQEIDRTATDLVVY